MQVITIARLHAMHQRSRKILIFLIAVYAPVTIACVVISVILSSYISGGKFQLQNSAHQAHGMTTRGARPLWYLSVHLCGKEPSSSDSRYLGTRRCMGGSRAVSCGLGCCTTLPWSATTIDRMGCWELIQGVGENLRVLFCSVSS